jgi:hypothetical protein
MSVSTEAEKVTIAKLPVEIKQHFTETQKQRHSKTNKTPNSSRATHRQICPGPESDGKHLPP